MSSVRSVVWIGLLAVVALVCSGCPGAPRAFGAWWQKEPLDSGDAQAFARALKGPASPEEPGIDGQFVGWYGVIVDVETHGDRSRVTLDHRYADSMNIQYGIRDSQAIHTVSLFGGGEFEFTTAAQDDESELIPGNLLRVYGTVQDTSAQRCILEAEATQLFPRFAYELAPLVAARDETGHLRRDSAGWPLLARNSSVDSARTQVDSRVRAALLARFPSWVEHKCNNTFSASVALAELGGEECVQALESARAGEADGQWRAHFEDCLARARREQGPRWKPELPDPYWKGRPSSPALDSFQRVW